jgi:hypothetical protein
MNPNVHDLASRDFSEKDLAHVRVRTDVHLFVPLLSIDTVVQYSECQIQDFFILNHKWQAHQTHSLSRRKTAVNAKHGGLNVIELFWDVENAAKRVTSAQVMVRECSGLTMLLHEVG